MPANSETLEFAHLAQGLNSKKLTDPAVNPFDPVLFTYLEVPFFKSGIRLSESLNSTY